MDAPHCGLDRQAFSGKDRDRAGWLSGFLPCSVLNFNRPNEQCSTLQKHSVVYKDATLSEMLTAIWHRPVQLSFDPCLLDNR
jgi:hypothetical protein